MKNQSRHFPFASPEKKSVLTLLITALLLVAVLLIASCRKTDLPLRNEEPVTGTETTTTMREAAALAVNTYYVSPTGNDNNPGSIDQPWFTLQKAWTVIAAGDLVYMRGGRYVYANQQGLTGKNGTSTDLIKIWAYPGETPVITRGSTFNRPYWHRSGVFFTGNYFQWKGIEITGFQNIDGNIESGLLAYNANNNTFEQLNIHDNHSGFYLEGNCTGNAFLNSDFHDNYDVQGSGGNSDGLATAYMTPLNSITTITGCRFWNNGDDGLDNFENSGYVLIDNCWSWHNGYIKGSNTPAGDGVGFKLGSDFLTTPANINVVKRRLQRSISFDNDNAGVHINEADFSTEIYNNTFFRNKITGLNFHYNNRVHTFRNNVTLSNTDKDVEISTASIRSNNSSGIAYNDGGWTINATAADFVSIDTAGVRNARQADGSLPNINFLKLAAGSDLIDAGISVGIPFNGNNPDRGANEYGGVVVTFVNQPPVVNAGADKSITLPTNTVTLSGSATDADGTIVAYAWTRVSGPSIPALTNANTASVSLSSLVAGTYVMRLTVTDNGGLTGYDDVKIVVNASVANLPPVVNAGPDKTITLPTSYVILYGSAVDPADTIVSYVWTYRSGPSTPTLSGAKTATLKAGNLKAGTYVFRLTAKDNKGLAAWDEVTVIVKTAISTKPINTANAILDAGNSYYVVQDFGILPDDVNNPTRSTLRIFENGVELNPAHSRHYDIETLGAGRFSHWGDGSFIVVYFSASDNSNPKTNGRTYTYTIQ